MISNDFQMISNYSSMISCDFLTPWGGLARLNSGELFGSPSTLSPRAPPGETQSSALFKTVLEEEVEGGLERSTQWLQPEAQSQADSI